MKDRRLRDDRPRRGRAGRAGPRRRRHSRDVFGVSHYADPDALKRLLRDAERRARNIPPISRIPHDEVESVLNVSLAQLIDDKVHPAGWAAMIQAIGGKFDKFPSYLKMDFIDELRKAKAKERGGDRRQIGLEDIEKTELGKIGPRIEPYLSKPFIEPDEDVFPPVRQAELQALQDELGDGPARCARFLASHPDPDDLTDAEIAEHCGVTKRTVYNWKIVFRTPEGQALADRLRRS